VVQIGLDKGVFEKDPDGSVWIDLTDEGLDRKIALRWYCGVYDAGYWNGHTTCKDYRMWAEWCIRLGMNRITILKCCFNLEKLGFDWSKNLFHLSYGMVDLPSGKMKSREGTVVDADDLMQEMTDTAQKFPKI
jgi:arginyl-tRNA synthetase